MENKKLIRNYDIPEIEDEKNEEEFEPDWDSMKGGRDYESDKQN
jgi:hypothetical protein